MAVAEVAPEVEVPRVDAARMAAMLRMLGHPLRIKLLRLLVEAEERLSPLQLAEELGVPLPNLAYHVRMMLRAKVIKRAGQRARRGAIQHYYRPTADGARLLAACEALLGGDSE